MAVNILDSHSSHLKEFKVLVVGPKKLGKTSLINMLFEKEFYEDYFPTKSVNVYPISLEHKGEKLRFNLWDCSERNWNLKSEGFKNPEYSAKG